MASATDRCRKSIRVRGVVQGVGLRPFVSRLASNAGLAGLVRNDVEGVWIEVEGAPAAIDGFERALVRGAPPLARIDAVEVFAAAPRGDASFRIEAGDVTERRAQAIVPADAAVCAACVAEMRDPTNRRHLYPFMNCTDCGPRFTIVRDVPYERAATTMDAFTMCALCRAEYDDATSRRFHAEPNA